MEIINEFVNPVESVAQGFLRNLGITEKNYMEHPYMWSHFNNIRNGILDANINFDGDIKRYAHHTLTRAVQIAQIEGDNSKISIPYGVAWGISTHDSIFTTVSEDKLRFLLDRALDYPLLEYTQKKLEATRDLELGIDKTRIISHDRIAGLNAAIVRCKEFQLKLREKASTQISKEAL